MSEKEKFVSKIRILEELVDIQNSKKELLMNLDSRDNMPSIISLLGITNRQIELIIKAIQGNT